MVWWLLLLTAVVAQILSVSQPVKKQAGTITTLLVFVPFVLVLGLFYLGRYFGTYQGNPLSRTCGAIITIAWPYSLFAVAYLSSP